MKPYLYAAVAAIIATGAWAQQPGGSSGQQSSGGSAPGGSAPGGSAQPGPGNNMGPPHGPPPNVRQAIELLEQAKQQTGAASVSLIEQAEELLKKPPPPRQGGMGHPDDGQAGVQKSPGQ